MPAHLRPAFLESHTTLLILGSTELDPTIAAMVAGAVVFGPAVKLAGAAGTLLLLKDKDNKTAANKTLVADGEVASTQDSLLWLRAAYLVARDNIAPRDRDTLQGAPSLWVAPPEEGSSANTARSPGERSRWRDDLARDDWEPMQTSPTWLNPCFFTSMTTALSAWKAVKLGLYPFCLGPVLVLLSSMCYWYNPQRDSWRRSLDLCAVRVGMASQVVLSLLHCVQGRLPAVGVVLILAGYAAAAPCYAAGRVLTVRGESVRGAWMHTEVHIFSNVGNLAMLPLVS